MSTASPSTFEEAIRHSGEGWLIDSFAVPEDAISHLLSVLDAVRKESRQRLGNNAPDLSEQTLLREYQRNPARVRGFFQALGGTRSPAMLLMVWRILQGMEVREVQMRYLRQKSFQVQVVLETQDGVVDAPYVSDNIHDFALFRHIGILEIGGEPVLDGFYPLRVHGVNR